MRKNFFALRVGARALEGAAQGDHGVSLPEDIQHPPELIPVSAALGDPALPEGGLHDFQRFFPTLTIL